MFDIVPLVSKFEFGAFTSFPADIRIPDKPNTINIRTSPVFKKNHPKLYICCIKK
jgi:hypothetical protein